MLQIASVSALFRKLDWNTKTKKNNYQTILSAPHFQEVKDLQSGINSLT